MSGTRFSMNYVYEQTDTQVNTFYCIETSVLLDIPLVKFIKTTSGTQVVIFHNLTQEFIDDVISVISLYYFIDVFLSK